MDRSALLEAVAGDLFTYVLNGRFPEDDISGLIKPAELPDAYEDYDRLVTLHFLLEEAVDKFVAELPGMLRTIKTETKTESSVQRGGIDGRIDWEATYQTRASSSPGDRSVYVVNSQTEQYAIPENIVLKALVETVNQGISDVDQYLNANRTWVKDSWLGNDERRERFQTTLERNVHLQRTPDPEPIEPTARMITRATQSRKRLYQRAGELYSQYASYHDSPEAVRSLLEETTITPSDEQKLFELFVLFSVITSLREADSPAIGTPTYHTLRSGRDAAATFDGDRQLRVFYDSVPDDPDIEFRNVPGPRPSRADIVHETSREVVDAFFTQTNTRAHTKRPDVMVVADDDQAAAESYLLVEVKHSQNSQTIRQGVTELLEYLTFVREGTDYEFEKGDFGTGLNGLLVIQDIEGDDIVPASLAEQERQDLPVRVVQASELQAAISRVLRREIFGYE